MTGGIASGKSTVGAMFEELGVTVIDADRIARQVVAAGTPGLAAVVRHFGAGVLDEQGQLDRAAMRDRVFADDDARRQLEQIIHPLVREEMARQVQAAKPPYCIADIPLLVESGQADQFDAVLVIDVPESVQRYRLKQRDQSDDRQIDAILAAQASRSQRLAAAQDVIDNTGSLQQLREQVACLHDRYLALAAEKLQVVAP